MVIVAHACNLISTQNNVVVGTSFLQTSKCITYNYIYTFILIVTQKNTNHNRDLYIFIGQPMITQSDAKQS